MQTRALICICASLFAAASLAQAPVPLAQEELMRNARTWEAHDRGDLARLALEKLVAARPDSADALLELGELNLRMPDMRAAEQVLQRLNSRFPGSAAARIFAIEYRYATRDRLQLASIQRLIQMQRGSDARRELDRLFPDGAPGGMLSIEYYRLLASTPGGWPLAHEGLKKLVAEHADDPRYQFALARHLLRNDATGAEGVAILGSLARRGDIRLREVDEALGPALRDVEYPVAPAIVEEYLSRHPDSAEVRDAALVRERKADERRLGSDAFARIEPQRQARDLKGLEKALAARAQGNPSARRAQALLQLLGGQTPEPSVADDATMLAGLWVNRSRASRDANELDLAAVQLEAALALRTRRFESAIPLTSRLDALGEHLLAAELIAAASRLDPQSGWLFETHVRRLIRFERTEEALARLDEHPLGIRWTAQSRDSLRAVALDQRAQSRAAAGRIDDAIADFEAAIALAPREPWSRYRLAGLHARRGDAERGRVVLDDGAALAPGNVEMRYAQALYLASIDDYERALAAVESIAANDRGEGANDLRARVRIELARKEAVERKTAGDLASARASLLAVEPLARQNIDRLRQLAFAWVEVGDAQRAIELADSFGGGDRREILMLRAEVLDRADDTTRLAATLDELRALSLSEDDRAGVVRMQRSFDLRRVRAMERNGDFASAARALDDMLAAAPADRELRIARAELDLAAGDSVAARDRFAELVAEEPEDVDTRLAYVRALTDAGEIELARLQLQTAQELADARDVDLQLGIARRQSGLGDFVGAGRTLQAALALAPRRADVLMQAGYVAVEARDYAAASEYFAHAQRVGDESEAVQALRVMNEIEVRRQSWVEGGIEMRHKPGDSGISKFDAVVLPTSWVYARNYEQRFVLRADGVTMESGKLGASFDDAALLGTIQAAGPAAVRLHDNDAQSGLGVGIGYVTDTLSADIGTTPLGFLLTNVVGGIEWTPEWGPLDVALGVSRRAVTSSVLSYGGLRDPISGVEWGGLVQTGPYARFGLYRERYSVSGSLTATEITGTRVPDNQFLGLRVSADWKFFSRDTARAFVGVTVNRWEYDKNLQNYTFGSGGYYSPQSYLSIAIPVEVQGELRGWSYRLRASVSHSSSRTQRIAFYPNDPDLQSRAALSPLPSGYDQPFFEADRSSGSVSLSAYAAVEKQISRAFVLGAKLDIDRADYYEPTILMFYLRHTFGPAATPLAVPPRPVRLYSDY